MLLQLFQIVLYVPERILALLLEFLIVLCCKNIFFWNVQWLFLAVVYEILYEKPICLSD